LSPAGGSGFTRVGEREIFQGHIISLAIGTFAAPDGERFEREVVHHPGAVAMVPLLDGGRTVILVRQYRAALEELLLELPAGKLDVPGEAPAAAAARELEEEIGYRAAHLEQVAEFYNSPGFCDERVFVFLATGLEAAPLSAQGVEESFMTVEPVALTEALAMVGDGRIRDAKTIIGLLLARTHLAA
jgi:ADP-ribose pyrophosphatase